MAKMVVDSMLLITRAVIRKTGVVPRSISVRVGDVGRTYYIDSIVDAACRITGKRRPKSVAKVKTVESLLSMAFRSVRRFRKNNPYLQYIDENGTDILRGQRCVAGDDVLDLRNGVECEGGLRLMSVAAGNGDTPTRERAIAGLELARKLQLIIAENYESSRRLQFYFAQHGVLTEVITGDMAARLDTTPVAWSEPFVNPN
ncbi:MAG: hypothetical protein ACRDBQ_18820 [Shewanella sp.]